MKKLRYYKNLLRTIKNEGLIRKPSVVLKHLKVKSGLFFSKKSLPKVKNIIQAKIEPSQHCPSKCTTCNFWRLKWLPNEKPFPEEKLTHEEFLSAINQVHELGCTEIQFLGGEPTLYKRLPELVSYANKKGMATNIVTNGLLIDKKLAKELVDAGISKIGFSMDGPERINDLVRGVKGAYKKQVDAIKEIVKLDKENKIKKDILVTVSTQNIDTLDRIIDIANNLKIPIVNFFLLSAYDRSVKEDDDKILKEKSISVEFMVPKNLIPKDIERLKKKKEEIIRIAKEKKIKIYGNLIEGNLDKLTKGIRREKRLCPIPFKFCLIDSYGNVCPCDLIRYSLGNIKKNTLKEIYESKKFEEFSKIYLKNHRNFKICDYCCYSS